MLRALVQPRMLGLHAATVLAIAAMIWLGIWQYDRWDQAGQSTAASAVSKLAPVDLASILAPGQDMSSKLGGRHVTVIGTYVSTAQVLLPGRDREGVRGYWVLTPLQTANGAATAILRGWVHEATEAGIASPGGQVAIAGQLQQAEPINATDDPLPTGQAQAASPVSFASLLDAPLYPGVVVLQSQTPTSGVAPVPIQIRVEGGGRAGAGLRNLAYAVQWWSFVAFAIFIWVRLVRDRLESPVRIEA